jgi:hypothetical protein
MIKLRIDVDYPYPSRAKSLATVALRRRSGKGNDYLRNASLIAQMVNESSKDVRAYWFFTPYTIPNKKLLQLLDPNKHEVALHLVNKPYEELKDLEQKTDRTIKYYSMHGTESKIAQVIWNRHGKCQVAPPRDFPLKSFHDFTTMSLDRERYLNGYVKNLESVHAWTSQSNDVVLSIHPEWLFKANNRTKRGPYYDVLKSALGVDSDLDTVVTYKSLNVNIARDYLEHCKSINPTSEYILKLEHMGQDIFTFIERKWCGHISNPSNKWVKSKDNIWLLEIQDYSRWGNMIGQENRDMTYKVEKNGIIVSVVSFNDILSECKNYKMATGQGFTHLIGESQLSMISNMYPEKNSTYIAGYQGDILAGFIQMYHCDGMTSLINILSLQERFDNTLEHALLSKAVEVCTKRGEKWLIFGRVENNDLSNNFKESNHFVKHSITRYYIPLTHKGRLATQLGLCRKNFNF